jgi:hypothetical protein
VRRGDLERLNEVALRARSIAECRTQRSARAPSIYVRRVDLDCAAEGVRGGVQASPAVLGGADQEPGPDTRPAVDAGAQEPDR